MDYHFLSKTPLFCGSTEEDIRSILSCLGAAEKHYEKGSTIYHAGEPAKAIGLVLSGRVQIENDDCWGNKNLLDSVEEGMIFAETYACLPKEPLQVSVTAAENSDILFLNAARVLQTCSGACEHHTRLIRNLLAVLAQKNLILSRKILHTSSKSIRGRLLSYLSFQAATRGSYEFTIPFNRQQLADYLGVDRSALSHEIGKMHKDGLLEADRNHFILRGRP